MKFATKLIWHRPLHLRHVATIPWEIKNSNVCRYSADMEENANKLHLIASNFVIRPQILIFSLLINGCLSPYWLQIKFFMLLFFWLFTFAVNLWHRKFVRADVTAVFVNNQHGIQRRWQDFNNSLYLKWYTASRSTDEFPEKCWTKCGVNKLLQTLRDTSTVYRRPEIWIFNFPR